MRTLYDNIADVPADKWRWPDFTPGEISCRGSGSILVDDRAMDMLQELRTRLGKAVHVNSGYRSPAHNRAIGGAKHSKHMEGIAFDCRMEGHDPQVFMATARDVGFRGIGEYPVLGFCHIDARDAAAHWLGSRGKAFPGAPAQAVTAPTRPAPAPQAAPTATRAPDASPRPTQRPASPLAAIIAAILRAFGKGDA